MASIALYETLKQAGFEDLTARAAAEMLLTSADKDNLATKQDIGDVKLAIAELKTTLIVWGFVAIFSALGVYSAIMIAIFRSFMR